MAKKKQQTIEATLGRPKAKVKVPKIRPPVAPKYNTPENPVIPSPGEPLSWFDTAKARNLHRPRESRPDPPPPSKFMPTSSGREGKISFSHSSSSADEASSLDDEDRAPKANARLAKRVTPGKGPGKQQTRLASGFSTLGLGSSPRSAVVVDDESSDGPLLTTPRASNRRTLKKRTELQALADDSDDAPLATHKALNRRPQGKQAQRPAPSDDSNDDELPTIASMVSNRSKRAKRALSDDDSDDDDIAIPSAKRRRLARKNGAGPSSPVETSATDRGSPSTVKAMPTPVKRNPRSNPRREKRKQRELLRRRRAGEDITLEDISTSEDEDHRGLYDTDSDHLALEEFEDDDEGVLEQEPLPKSKKRAGKRSKGPKQKAGRVDASEDEEAEDEMADFIEEDDDGVIGVPNELLDIPLEFTGLSRKPLKEHFRHVVQWLVQFQFEHNFDEKHNELYLMAWSKLDDEVQGLASSKFASSAWKPDFRRALNARPKFVSIELPRGDLRGLESCMACGRSGHPATWIVQFEGLPYYRKKNSHSHFLEDVESEDESEDESTAESFDPDEDGEDRARRPERRAKKERDEDGNVLPSQEKKWSVGVVCKSNAETAHTLIHWKHNLLVWVGDRLENEGYMTPEQIAARAKMKRKQKNKIIEQIIDQWDSKRVIEALYRDFKDVLEQARNKSTSGRGGGRWGR